MTKWLAITSMPKIAKYWVRETFCGHIKYGIAHWHGDYIRVDPPAELPDFAEPSAKLISPSLMMVTEAIALGTQWREGELP